MPLGLRARHRGLRDRARPALGHGVPDRRRGDRDLARHRDPRRADRPPRRGGQLLVDARRRPRRTVFGDLRGPRTRVRGRGRTRGRRGAPHRGLEPRLHAGRGRRSHAGPARAPQQEHRHRRQRGARGRRAAGRGPRVRDRPAASARRGRRVALGASVGRRRARRRLAQGDRRARPRDHVPDGRWRAALQRGPRLHRAPDAPPRRLARAAARDREGGHAGAGRADGRTVRARVPGAGGEPRVRRAGRELGGGSVRRHAAAGDDAVRDRDREGGRCEAAAGRRGLQAPRHVRLPQGAHERARGRGGVRDRRRAVRGPDGGAARAREAFGAERARRGGARRRRRRGRHDRVRRATRPSSPTDGCSR